MAFVSSLADFEIARQRWHAAVAEGRLEAAQALLEQAWEWVEASGDAVLRERVLCNRAAVAIELGDGDGFLPALKEVLLRTNDAANARLAAYTASRGYELRDDLKKAQFYARLAQQSSVRLAEQRWIASSANQLANLLVAGGRFAEAVVEYRSALVALGEEDALGQAIISYNLGYCQTVLGEQRTGLAALYSSLRALRRLGAERHEAQARLDLAFALLEAGRPERARRHAGRALALARAHGESRAVRNALFLIGSALRASGDEGSARLYYRQLQTDFYPDADYLPELLSGVDFRAVVNLRG